MAFILRNPDPELWEAFKLRAASEGRSLRWVILELIRRYVRTGLVIIAALALSACHGVQPNPSAPSAPPATPIAPTKIALVPSPGILPIGGGTAVIRIVTSDGSTPAPLARVSLTASSGELDRHEVTTDAFGHAEVTWTGTSSDSVTATAGSVTETVTVPVQQEPVFPPNPPPAPPRTPPTQPPPTTPTPQEEPLTVTLTPAQPSVMTGQAQTYTAAVTNLRPGEQALYYEWNFTSGATPDATTTVTTRSHTYTTHGVKRQFVTARTNQGRVGTGSSSVIVTSPLR